MHADGELGTLRHVAVVLGVVGNFDVRRRVQRVHVTVSRLVRVFALRSCQVDCNFGFTFEQKLLLPLTSTSLCT